MARIAIFASGSGSNALRIIQHFSDDEQNSVSLIVCNKTAAGVVKHGFDHNVPVLILRKARINDRPFMDSVFDSFRIDFVALAGFLLLIPEFIVERFEGKIVNIHPALLPKYGGKGMYGMNVHKAVKTAGETETGITIHYVNSQYDEGNIIAQYRCKIDDKDTPEEIAEKVQALEHTHYPKVIRGIIE